jgi:SAM-dependent methyltransferase
MARLDPLPDNLPRYYPSQYWFEGGAANVWRKLVLLDHVRFTGRVQRILDAGSGGGLFAELLRRRGVEAFALDISLHAARLAARGAPAVAADFGDAPFSDATWDAIAMFHTLEHVPDPRRHLGSAHRLLRPGGRLIIAVPNFASLQRRIFGARWNGLDLPRHLYHFRAQDLQALLEQSGFRVTGRRYFSWRDSPAGLATTLAPALDPMARLIRGCPNPLAIAAFAALTALCIPFTALEAALRQGSVVLMRAERL